MNASVGPTVSIVNELVVALPGLPAASTTRTVIVCEPSATVANVRRRARDRRPRSTAHVGDVPSCVNPTADRCCCRARADR
jgi:hypothetical protein